ncbi:MAG: bifunctional 2-C-methyl-D-erythritol 4-phosphate cytidylyltransferase/2-C-methyl-D-erythritol 2,4-cyclodiphosphate synthase [Campylobacteraceae bacterium]|nr:bifunctional 2-C-methyl-D-erythritol 4-phosphate cytidylyltransferase/2-C-methyl-D-erythritol 2,4-cyclodiphosphate synthase [Campylobacteraceae bacterium]
MLDISLIVLSAGASTRFKMKVKKQWIRVGDIPLWVYATNNLNKTYAFKDVIVTGNADELFYMYKFTDFKIIEGGNTRQSSLINALQHVKTKYVLVSDAARCCVPPFLVRRLLNEAGSADSIVPYLTVADTVAYENDTAIHRDKVKLIQTPQLSLTQALKEALIQKSEFTDESSAIKANGGSVKYILGDIAAEKLTTLDANSSIFSLLKAPVKDCFYGNGFDVHAFEEAKPMYLGGVKIDTDFGFKAHSDGDVAIHALIDALLAAAGGGDIGEWFPDFDERYKNIDSTKLLENVCGFLARVGFEIIHCDLTIIAQRPKILPYKQAISKKLASILNIPSVHVNVKATTTEHLGFIGREEGIGVLASATLKYYDWTADENINR